MTVVFEGNVGGGSALIFALGRESGTNFGIADHPLGVGTTFPRSPYPGSVKVADVASAFRDDAPLPDAGCYYLQKE